MQEAHIKSLQTQNQQLQGLLGPKSLVNANSQAVTTSQKIGSQLTVKGGVENKGAGFSSKPYLGKPRPLQLGPGADGSLNPELECHYCKDTGNLEDNCIKLNHQLAYQQKSTEKISKLDTPLSKDQGKGGANSGPQDKDFIVNVLRSISSQGILAKDKVEIMQQTLAKCSKINIASMGVQVPSLLDSGSKFSLIRYSYFREHLLPKIEAPISEKSDAHILFNLTAANDG